ncbi:MAG TPA: hypothetical protein VNJ08_09545 [Bacteriovoracaceae bacterium]|nr:hypothetical protein [Bacteriovoracaceae bacterium]
MKNLLIMIFAILIYGCKLEIETKIKVTDSAPLIVQTRDGEKLILPVGDIKGELVIDGKKPENSFLKLYLMRNNKKFRPEIPLKLPDINTLLGSNDPVKLESKELGQTFGMMVMRQIRPGKDLFIMTFHDAEFTNSSAEMSFEYEPSKVLYDENKKEFLASYQTVKRKQRALVVRIDGDIDGGLSMARSFGWLEKTLDHIVNYSGAALISPWAYARYSEVKWVIGDESRDDKDANKWKGVVKEFPVIDYFAFVHSGSQELPDNLNAEELSLKKNQLRVVYTGACYSKHGTEWIKDFTAVAAGGQRGLSASPLFQFTVLRKWVYGYSFENSLIDAYHAGARKVRALEWITFAKLWQNKTGVLAWKNVDDMLTSSEILFSYTDEVPAKNLHISQSAILSKIPENDEIVRKGVVEAKKENKSEIVEKNPAELL